MVIQVNKLKKIFGNKEVINIEKLTINEGEIIGIVGNNGAGKSTFLKLILDLTKATDGNVFINGKNVATSGIWKKYTAAYLGDQFLIDYLTPEEYFELIGFFHHIDKREITNRLQAYDFFSNNEILNQQKFIRNFSSGNKQKIGIIGAMLPIPQILILDEPFNYLDPSSQMILVKILLNFHQYANSIIIISSHNITYLPDLCTRFLLMEDGVIKKDIPSKNDQEIKEYFLNHCK